MIEAEDTHRPVAPRHHHDGGVAQDHAFPGKPCLRKARTVTGRAAKKRCWTKRGGQKSGQLLFAKAQAVSHQESEFRGPVQGFLSKCQTRFDQGALDILFGDPIKALDGIGRDAEVGFAECNRDDLLVFITCAANLARGGAGHDIRVREQTGCHRDQVMERRIR